MTGEVNLKILIADGDAQAADLLKQTLASFKITDTEIVSSAPDVWQKLNEAEYDILFCELDLSPTGGIDLIHKLRSSPLSPDPIIPIITHTLSCTADDVKNARDAGSTEFLAKPLNIKSLINVLTIVAEKPRYFVFSENFIGPDRRRKNTPLAKGEFDKRKVFL
jgi:two-component system chemotaxis response regulator CheY